MSVRSRFLLFLAVPLLLGAAPQAAGGEAKKKASPPAAEAPSLDALRKRCYGGRKARASRADLSLWDRLALQAAAKGDHERMAHWTRRALQGHGDERALLPSYLLASEMSESKLPDDAFEACNELFTRLPVPED